ncbi:unnamed protein product [marine sediment metagenome]|uniref:Uncharacterized protein n=1 Tax=marine sediment metagenome TaxID=412755 RepID=X1LEH8_9ZZZZ
MRRTPRFRQAKDVVESFNPEPIPSVEPDDPSMKNSKQTKESQESKEGLDTRHKDQGENNPEKDLIF